ncbi:MAG: hypothetical protein KDE27_03670 [Planctomycetes bacterium]|nr:hypothetical protein [Planctomycetota bacterium]
MNAHAAASFAPLLSAAVALSQAAVPVALKDLRVPVHELTEAGVTETWAGTASYKVGFHGDMTFVPYLGDYPRNQPWSWHTTAVRAGSADLLGGEPQRWHSDHRYEYRYADVTEAYDVGADGLEQTFVIARPGGAGDLVVTGTVATALTAVPSGPCHGALVFRDADGAAIVGYGAATAVDARGGRIALATTWDGSELSLRVPGDWLAAAHYPVTIDPLLTRSSMYSSGASYGVRETSIAQGSLAVSSDIVLVTYTRRASQFDDDVLAVSSLGDFSQAQLIYAALGTTTDDDDPCCAWADGYWAIVYRSYRPTGLRSSRLRAHTRLQSDTAYRTTYTEHTQPLGYNAWRPDIGGSRSSGTARSLLVVYQYEDNTATSGNWANTPSSDVHAVLLRPWSSSIWGQAFALASGADDHERPAVNQQNHGDPTSPWIAVWQSAVNGRWQLTGRMVGSSASVSSAAWSSDLAASAAEHEVAPAVAGSNGRYAVVFATQDAVVNPTPNGSDRGERLFVERFDWPDGATAPSGDKPPVELVSAPSAIYAASDITFNTGTRSFFTVAFYSVSPAAAWCARVGYNGAAVEGPELLYQTIGDSVSWPACTGTSWPWFAYVAASSASQTVYGQTMSFPSAPPVTFDGSACVPASLSFSGTQLIGSEFETCSVDFAPASAGHFALLAAAPADLPMIYPGVGANCRLLVDSNAILAMLPFQLGTSASWTFGVPEFLPALTLYFQDWIFDGTEFLSTKRTSVPYVR